MYTNIHTDIYKKLEEFNNTNKIPHLIFHGSSGSGKRTIVNWFISKIYNNDISKIKSNVMMVNCAHGKGIKFIREELKFFAKTNINANNGKNFKIILLINAGCLTIDAQSALRRCIENFSFNTRFFIIIKNKNELLNPILSRFCEIYVPELIVNGKPINLHKSHITRNYSFNQDENKWLDEKLQNINTHIELVNMTQDIYEKGISGIYLIDWINNNPIFSKRTKTNVLICFDKIKSEFRCEKFIILYILDLLYMRPNNDLKSMIEL
jgi:hypothetical protein